jgi:hypothetical protein
MRESCTYGSKRGALSNGRSYRDLSQCVNWRRQSVALGHSLLTQFCIDVGFCQ